MVVFWLKGILLTARFFQAGNHDRAEGNFVRKDTLDTLISGIFFQSAVLWHRGRVEGEGECSSFEHTRGYQMAVDRRARGGWVYVVHEGLNEMVFLEGCH